MIFQNDFYWSKSCFIFYAAIRTICICECCLMVKSSRSQFLFFLSFFLTVCIYKSRKTFAFCEYLYQFELTSSRISCQRALDVNKYAINHQPIIPVDKTWLRVFQWPIFFVILFWCMTWYIIISHIIISVCVLIWI